MSQIKQLCILLDTKKQKKGNIIFLSSSDTSRIFLLKKGNIKIVEVMKTEMKPSKTFRVECLHFLHFGNRAIWQDWLESSWINRGIVIANSENRHTWSVIGSRNYGRCTTITFSFFRHWSEKRWWNSFYFGNNYVPLLFNSDIQSENKISDLFHFKL